MENSSVIRVEIKRELLSWARERAGYDTDALAHRFPKLAAWERGTAQPTLKQVEKFASSVDCQSMSRWPQLDGNV